MDRATADAILDTQLRDLGVNIDHTNDQEGNDRDLIEDTRATLALRNELADDSFAKMDLRLAQETQMALVLEDQPNQPILLTGHAAMIGDSPLASQLDLGLTGWVFCERDNSIHTPSSEHESAEHQKPALSAIERSETELICAACEEPLPGNRFVQTSCGHLYCRTCINGFFDDLTHDEPGSTPTCCVTSVRVMFGSRHRFPRRGATLHYDEVERSMVLACMGCADALKGRPFLWLWCGHCFCVECVIGQFQLAAKNESQCPSKCCDRPLPISKARRLLPADLEAAYLRKVIESTTKDRTYCHDNKCGDFILPSHIENGMAVCEKCLRITCTECKTVAHRGECPPNPEHEALKELAAHEGYQQCPGCKRLVELSVGCYHMTCHCGAEFCYVCGVAWKNCSCPPVDEDRLYGANENPHDHRAFDQADLMAEAVTQRRRIAAAAPLIAQHDRVLELQLQFREARRANANADLADIEDQLERARRVFFETGQEYFQRDPALGRALHFQLHLVGLDPQPFIDRLLRVHVPEQALLPMYPPPPVGRLPPLPPPPEVGYQVDLQVNVPAAAVPIPIPARQLPPGPIVPPVPPTECFHGGYWARVETGEMRCNQCRYRPRVFILECSNCQTRACVRCRRGVLRERALAHRAEVETAAST